MFYFNLLPLFLVPWLRKLCLFKGQSGFYSAYLV